MKTLIIDDEQLVLQKLREMLTTYFPSLTIVGEASSGEEGLQLIYKTNPDLVLLDIQMPGMSGFEMLEKLPHYPFSVIFITAYHQYAIQAFKMSALDYLLKPLQLEELRAAVYKAEERQNEKQLASQIEQVLQMNRNPHQLPRLVLQLPTETRLIELREIVRLECSDSYTMIHLDKKERDKEKEKLVVIRSLTEYEEMLQPYDFLRCHQSHLVNLAFIRRVNFTRGASEVELLNEKIIPLARSKRDFIRDYFKKGGKGLIG